MVRAENAGIAKAMAGKAAAKKSGTRKISASTGEPEVEESAEAARTRASASKGKVTPISEAPSAKGKKATTAKAPAAKPAKASKNGTSKADLVRAEYAKNKDAKPSEIAKATDVTPAYVWDIIAAVKRKEAKEAKASK